MIALNMTLYAQIGKLIKSQVIRERKRVGDGLLLIKARPASCGLPFLTQRRELLFEST